MCQLKILAVFLILSIVDNIYGAPPNPQLISADGSATRLYGKQIRKILDDLRDRMHMDMTESMGIPRLDPLTIEHLKINNTELGLELTAMNIKAVGLQQFETTAADLSVIRSRLVVGFKVPSITLTGDYELAGNVGGLIPLHGNGKLNIVINNIVLDITAKLSFFPTRVNSTLDLDFDSIVVDLDGLMGGGELGEFFNELINAIIPEIFDEYYPELKSEIEEMVDKLASEMMAESSLQDLVNIIINGVKFPPIEPKS